MVAKYLIEPRDAKTGLRIGRPVELFNSLKIVSRLNNPGTVQITADWKYLMDCFGGLPIEGKGIVISGEGVEEMTCLLRSAERTGDGSATLTFDDDIFFFWKNFVRPEPLKPVNLQLFTTWQRTDTPENLIRTLVSLNVGPGALASRRWSIPVRIPDAQGIGSGATVSVRIDRSRSLGDAVAEIAEAGNLRVRLLLREGTDGAPYWQLVISERQDVSNEVRYGPVEGGAPGRVEEDWTYTVQAPSVTRGILGGGGTGDGKIYFEDTLDGQGVDLWGYNLEGYIDAQDLDPLDDLNNRVEAFNDLAQAATWAQIDMNRLFSIISNLQYTRDLLNNNGNIDVIIGNVDQALVQYSALDQDTDITQDEISKGVSFGDLAVGDDTNGKITMNAIKLLQAAYVNAWTNSGDVTTGLSTAAANLRNNPNRATEASRLNDVAALLTVARNYVAQYAGGISVQLLAFNQRTQTINQNRITANNENMYNQTQAGLSANRASVAVTASIIDSPLFPFRTAWNVGDKIAWSVDGYDAIDYVREAEITVSGSGLHEQIKFALGPDGTSTSDTESIITAQTAGQIVRGVRSLQQR